MAAAAVVPIGAPCPDCRGGGEVNGLECRSCEGLGRTALRRRRWRFPSLLGIADKLATPVGTLVGWSMSLPGLAGAAGVSYGVAATVHAVFGQVPLLAVAAVVGGVFALLVDRKMP